MRKPSTLTRAIDAQRNRRDQLRAQANEATFLLREAEQALSNLEEIRDKDISARKKKSPKQAPVVKPNG